VLVGVGDPRLGRLGFRFWVLFRVDGKAHELAVFPLFDPGGQPAFDTQNIDAALVVRMVVLLLLVVLEENARIRVVVSHACSYAAILLSVSTSAATSSRKALTSLAS